MRKSFCRNENGCGSKKSFWKDLKIKLKKLLTETTAYDNINKLSLRQQQRTLKTEQYVKP